MFSLIFYFCFQKIKTLKMCFQMEMYFYICLKLYFLSSIFILSKIKILISTGNEILLFSIFDSFEKIFSLKMFSKIQTNAFSSPFSISNQNENTKQSDQHLLIFPINYCILNIFFSCLLIRPFFYSR